MPKAYVSYRKPSGEQREKARQRMRAVNSADTPNDNNRENI